MTHEQSGNAADAAQFKANFDVNSSRIAGEIHGMRGAYKTVPPGVQLPAYDETEKLLDKLRDQVASYTDQFLADNKSVRQRYEFESLLRQYNEVSTSNWEEAEERGGPPPFDEPGGWFVYFKETFGIYLGIYPDASYDGFEQSFVNFQRSASPVLSAEACLSELDEMLSTGEYTGSQKAEMREFRRQLLPFVKAQVHTQ